MDTNNSHDLDLPLMSNIDDIYVKHYVLDLLCSFDDKVFSGSVTLFCEPRNKVEADAPHLKETDTKSHGGLVSCEKCSVIENPFETFERKDDRLLETFSSEHSLKQTTAVSRSAIHPLSPERDLSEDITFDNKNESVSNRLTDYSSETCKQHQMETPLKSIQDYKISKFSTETKYETCNDIQINEHSNHFTNIVMVLDSWDLEVEAVQYLCVPTDALASSHNTDFEQCAKHIMLDSVKAEPLCFNNEKKCLKIWKDGVKHWREFPQVVRILYKTIPTGQSLKWTLDQDGKPCVYTHGHWINNRSLFPSQDVPVAMATWSATIHAPCEAVVLMSGDDNPEVTSCYSRQGYQSYRYHTKMEMPSSTVALAVGHWSRLDIVGVDPDPPYREQQDLRPLPCRLFSPASLLPGARDLLIDYLPGALTGAQTLLGPHPFSRQDILMVPNSFASLGMASPSLMFLSQSVLSPDGGMLVRVSHEISHSWFGLLIGPRDWHEEWLSEGFCTYTEGVIHATCMKWEEDECKQRTQLQDYLKYKTLAAEVDTTQDELQTLRYEEQTSGVDGVTYVKNGMNPDKGFMQVHYLKGYFLLRYLEDKVGPANFRDFLRLAVKQFHRKLITSEVCTEDMFSLFLKTFPQDELSGISKESLQEWLDKPGIPQELQPPKLEEITLAVPVLSLVERIKRLQETYCKLHWRKRKKLDVPGVLNIPKLTGDQIVLLMELLLNEVKLHADILTSLKETLQLNKVFPDVQHRWCELVVKHRLEASYKDIQYFLVNHQAMGVYLFGELMVTRDAIQRRLAMDTFDKIKSEMEEGTRKTVAVMLYGE